MNKFLKILYNPSYVFEQLDKLYEEELNANSTLITLLFGGLSGIYSCIGEYEHLKEIVSGSGPVIVCIILVLASPGICLLIYNYFFTFILYWLGKLLGSKGVIADTRTAIAYSLIPGLLCIALLIVQTLIPHSLMDLKNQFWIIRALSLMIWIWSMIILVIGLKTFNKYGIQKAITNVLPLPLSGILIMLIKYL